VNPDWLRAIVAEARSIRAALAASVGSSGEAESRDPGCIERWPECESGGYDPRCCRFPKSCSCASGEAESGEASPAKRLTSDEYRTYQSLRARGFSHDDALSDALDGVDVDDVRQAKLRAPVPSGEAPAAVIDAAHLERQREWSARTFGPGSRLRGVLAHIRKELAEVEANPTDIEEWVDVLILAFDGAWRAGWEPQQIIDAIVAKQTKNEGRTWPDWRGQSEDEAIEHVRSSGEAESGEAGKPYDPVRWCRHPGCKDTNWGGWGRVHLRDPNCPPDLEGKYLDRQPQDPPPAPVPSGGQADGEGERLLESLYRERWAEWERLVRDQATDKSIARAWGWLNGVLEAKETIAAARPVLSREALDEVRRLLAAWRSASSVADWTPPGYVLDPVPFSRFDGSELLMCLECGALVASPVTHDRWHAQGGEQA
jgi:hypothetical protein